MTARTAVLVDDRDRPIGKTSVPERTFVIRHDDRFFFRTAEAIRLGGGGVGVRFVEMEPAVRSKLFPI